MEDIEDGVEDSDDDSEDEDEYEQTALESYTTPLDEDETPVDEYVLFKQTMELLQQREPEWFKALMCPLSPDQQKVLQEVYTLAQQRKAAAGESVHSSSRVSCLFFLCRVSCHRKAGWIQLQLCHSP